MNTPATGIRLRKSYAFIYAMFCCPFYVAHTTINYFSCKQQTERNKQKKKKKKLKKQKTSNIKLISIELLWVVVFMRQTIVSNGSACCDVLEPLSC